MKYTLLKTLEVLGLKVFDPVVRLCYGEEPRLQLKQIGLFLVLPAVTFAAFLAVWGYVGPRHKTKSGEVPGPARVWQAYEGIVQFHRRQYTREADFARDGAARAAALEEAQTRQAEVTKQLAEVETRFTALEAERRAELDAQLEPLEAAVEKRQAQFAAQAAEREQKLLAAAEIAPGDAKARVAYKEQVREHLAAREAEQQELNDLRAQLTARRAAKHPPLEAVREEKTALEEEKQFLAGRIAILTENNREARLASAVEEIRREQPAFEEASGAELLTLATRMVQLEDRALAAADSSFAKPPTFFDQIATSLKCVFVGFLIGTAVAVPLGVLCGLSRVFMAAMMPLISLFKPVSPIVWLPIVFIIVGGFIANPEEAWAPPAFLSSAITVALCSLWPTLVNTALGVASIDRDHMNVARVLRLSPWTRLTRIVIPSALPLIFAGLRISLGVGWMVLIAAELLSSSPGIGKFVWDMFNNGSSETFAQMFVVVFFVGVIGLLLDRLMIVLQRLVSFDEAAPAL